MSQASGMSFYFLFLLMFIYFRLYTTTATTLPICHVTWTTTTAVTPPWAGTWAVVVAAGAAGSCHQQGSRHFLVCFILFYFIFTNGFLLAKLHVQYHTTMMMTTITILATPFHSQIWVWGGLYVVFLSLTWWWPQVLFQQLTPQKRLEWCIKAQWQLQVCIFFTSFEHI